MAAKKPRKGYLPNPLFSDAVITDRYRDMYFQCKRFLVDWNKKAPVKHDFDGSVLYAVTVCAMHDIARYKIYHLGDPARQKLDAVKRVAFYSKWIARLHPIYALRTGSVTRKYNDDDKFLFANEVFALVISLNHLRADPRVPAGYRIRQELWGSLLYDMKYRALSEDAYISTYQMIFDDSCGLHPTIP